MCVSGGGGLGTIALKANTQPVALSGVFRGVSQCVAAESRMLDWVLLDLSAE